MADGPKITAVIPSYNSAGFLPEAVESVLSQSYADVELIVVDDGSVDDTSEVIGRYGDAVKYIYKENGGVSRARNTGIEAASGEFIAFLDADDAWLPQKLELQMKVIESRSDSLAAHTDFNIGDSELNVVGVTISDRGDDILEDLFLKGNVIGTPSSVLVAKEVIEKTGGFDPDLSLCADWDMWIRIACETGFGYVDSPQIIYRQHDSNMSNDAKLLDVDSNLMFEKAFENPNVPDRIKERKRDAIGKNEMVLAGTYFQAGMYGDFLRCTKNSLANDISQVGYLLQFPLRVLQRKSS